MDQLERNVAALWSAVHRAAGAKGVGEPAAAAILESSSEARSYASAAVVLGVSTGRREVLETASTPEKALDVEPTTPTNGTDLNQGLSSFGPTTQSRVELAPPAVTLETETWTPIRDIVSETEPETLIGRFLRRMGWRR